MRYGAENIDALWMIAVSDVLRDGRSVGSRANGRSSRTLEVVGWSATLEDTSRNFLANARRKLDPVYASAELLWYLSGKNTLEAVTPYAPSYDKFAEPDGQAYGAYGYRIRHNHSSGRDQLQLAMDVLDGHHESRQAVVSLWKPDDLGQSKRDLPCTVCWQFLRRDDRLHMVTYMRSNDVWLGLPYDVYVFTCIQRLVAHTLGIEPGSYVHNVGSLHIYDRDIKKCSEALDASPKHLSKAHGWMRDILDDAGAAVALESEMRDGNVSSHDRLRTLISQNALEGVLADSVACLSHRWLAMPSYPSSPALRDALKHYKRKEG